ncbi:peptide/nickel transport system substrate-binding protein [Kribbella orskensis]|uniref:Peptide/nickel transport system substrate-binding protein n=1 Tax=Kribbella orskensis TaxID=2512216 RepID=A0ABY2BNA0_9ACTN|nr:MULTISPECIES: ABC transporter substrate-binding protein [Kribbella]TCN41698.1 peptide/nickel transport system substrate-binding protein [Kribbella sp. VKM Ac-2500]TCO25576.1 peptide/nickel transport system substrate-binding protein [Kribbella orskensis]
MSRQKLTIAAICAFTLAAAACGGGTETPSGTEGQAVTGGTLNMLGAGDVDYMDPNISYYSIGYLGLRMWSRQLFTYPAEDGKTTAPVADLATEIPSTSNGGVSADGKTYTIKIRSGAQWNTNPARQVTAADVVRGVKRTCNPVQPFGGIPDFASLLEGYQAFCDGFAKAGKTAAAIGGYIEGTDLPAVKAQDDTTVVFTLTQPATYFVDMLTLPAFSPAPKEFNSYIPASAELAQHTLSDGPYQIESYAPTKSIVFTRNPAWQASSDPVRKAYVDKIMINETVSQDSTQQQLQTGTPTADMEFDNFPPPSQLPNLINTKDPNLNLGPTASTNPYVVFNTASPNNNKAMAKPEFRQALMYGINRANIIQVLGGTKVNRPLTHVLPQDILGSKDSDLYPYDATKAKDMLAAAGFPNGLTLKFLYRNASEGSSKTFQTVQQDLSKIGIKVVGVPSPNADFYTKYLQVPTVAQRGVWDLSLAGWGADWYGNAALSFFAPLFAGSRAFPPIGSNFGLYDSAATNALILQAATAKTTDESTALWAQADEQVMKDAPFFPITNPIQANYRATQVHNAIYIPAIQNFDPTNVWLSQDKQGG